MIKVLDKGFVSLKQSMGTDAFIAQAARVSTSGISKGMDDDARLIDYLMRHGHLSPFEQAAVTFHVKLPLSVARQWMRHRTQAFNEISARYVVVPDELYHPEWRSQGDSNKQASGEVLPDITQLQLNNSYYDVKESLSDYQGLIEAGVEHGQARNRLPQAMYTQFYVTASLRNWLDFIRQRSHESAQKEIQDYACAIRHELAGLFPATLSAWENHVEEAVTFSGDEWAALQSAIEGAENSGHNDILVDVRYAAEDILKKQRVRKSRLKEFSRKLFGV